MRKPPCVSTAPFGRPGRPGGVDDEARPIGLDGERPPPIALAGHRLVPPAIAARRPGDLAAQAAGGPARAAPTGTGATASSAVSFIFTI